MRKSKIFISIALFVVVIIVIIAFCNFNNSSGKENEIIKNYSFTPTKNEKIDISLNSDNIKIIKSNTKNIEVTTRNYVDNHTNFNVFQDSKGDVSIISNTPSNNMNFKIGFFTFSFGSPIHYSNKVIVKIPENLNLDNFNCSFNSGNIKIDGLTSKDIALNLCNGNIYLDNLKLNNLNTSLINGTIEAQNITSSKDIFKNANGNITLNNLTGDNLKASLENGNIDTKDIYMENVNFDVNLGNISLENTKDNSYVINKLYAKENLGHTNISAKYNTLNS